ncbi:MAG: MalY/PatB family protein [Paenibacillus macerans]|uniref:cysteine-S-conjugate beta-lyase n=1 Tax=Paenibacillus macerans TaxID=44252 RepID=A0A6N8ERP7_PAEMA|nr:MalY/PatB family protein [Paenibacillus macerans]MDU7476677.1 MalY/PatB family protein [Paenibacillus macerans]MUG22315.1 putative C-S lyase [Paenibacillus macerans]
MRSHFDQRVNRMGTYCTQWDFIQDRFGVNDLLPFSISDMDFQSPPEILEALKERTNHGVFGYTRWNHTDYKSSITYWYETRFGANIEMDWIVYSPSVIYSIARLIEILTSEADHIVMQTPAYDAFFPLIREMKRKLVSNPLLLKEGSYEIDFTDLEHKLSDPKAKVFLLCNPHNPTGRLWTKPELTRIVDLCKRYGVKVISDDIHMDITYHQRTYLPMTSVANDAEHIFICSSASKTFNTPGLGGSYAIIANEDIRERFLRLLKGRDGVSSANIFGEIAVIEGYRRSGYWVDELCSYLYNNMKIIKEYIATELPILQFTIPESTYLAWIDCTGVLKTQKELQHALVHTGKVGIMPGDVYGEDRGVFLRMNVGCPQSKLLEGLERLKSSVLYMKR